MDRHGVDGQLNVYVLDVDSDVTGHGRHNRLVVSGDPHGPQVTIREDVRGLPMSTEADRMKVANGWQRLHGRGLVLVATASARVGDSIFHEYEARRRR